MSNKNTIVAIHKMGLDVRCVDGEFRINFPGGNEGTAYYTEDAYDAIATAKAMMEESIGTAFSDSNIWV